MNIHIIKPDPCASLKNTWEKAWMNIHIIEPGPCTSLGPYAWHGRKR